MSDPRTSTSSRLSFGKIPEILPIPDLIAIQRQSFEWLITDGLRETFDEISPIEDFTGQMALTFGEHRFEEPEHSVKDALHGSSAAAGLHPHGRQAGPGGGGTGPRGMRLGCGRTSTGFAITWSVGPSRPVVIHRTQRATN